MNLGVNIDHVAVLREARRVNDPDILQAMFEATKAGANQITIHLREDSRHINSYDAENIVKFSKIPVNIECSIDPEIISIISKLRPNRATIVPEKREELTTEGGLNLDSKGLKEAIKSLKERDIEVSLFIDPNESCVKKSLELGASYIELHTGLFSNLYLMLNSNLNKTPHCIESLNLDKTTLRSNLERELERITKSAKLAKSLGLEVAAGHGLNYQNVNLITSIKEITELNIGQSIVARSVFVGLQKAIKEMLTCIR